MLQLSYPGGKAKTVTLSFDDNQIHDRRLVSMLNRYGLKSTFHVVTSWLGRDGYLEAGEISSLYQGHEVALHGHSHRSMTELSAQEIIRDISENRRILEDLTGSAVRGMSYPMGGFGPEVTPVLKALDVLYSRTTQATGGFSLPEELLTWQPTIHYTRGTARYSQGATYPRTILPEKTQEFLQSGPGSLLYVWGHSYEFPTFDNWDVMEDFCKTLSRQSDIWFATNLEVAEYLLAFRALETAPEGSAVRNPSGRDVWILWDGKSHCLPAGQTVFLP